MCHDATLVVLDIVVVEQAEVLGERGFQTRVTLFDVQGIGVVGDVEQVGHGRLAAGATIGEAQLADFRDLPSEIGRRRHVGDGACRIGMHTLIVLNEVRLLRHHLESNVQVVVLAGDAQGYLGRMDVVLILRESAQLFVQKEVNGRRA